MANFQYEKYRTVNKIVVNHSVQFYRKCWMHRNESYHNPETQRNRIIEWYNKLKSYIERDEPLIVKLFVRKNPINVEDSNTETIKRWIYNVKEIMKKAEKLPRNDIRRYFEC